MLILLNAPHRNTRAEDMFDGKLGVIRVVTSQLGFTRAFSIRVFITRNVVPTFMDLDLPCFGLLTKCATSNQCFFIYILTKFIQQKLLRIKFRIFFYCIPIENITFLSVATLLLNTITTA